MLQVKKLKKRTILLLATAIIAVGVIGTSTAVWAAKMTPTVHTDSNEGTVYNENTNFTTGERERQENREALAELAEENERLKEALLNTFRSSTHPYRI